MSQFDASSDNTNPFGGERQPQSSAQGVQPAADYSTDISERADDQPTGFAQGDRFENRSERTGGQTTGSNQGGQFDNRSERTSGQTTGFDQGGRFENRPEGTQGSQPTYDIDGQPENSSATEYQPTRAGGAARGHNDDLSEGKASMMDKVIGKTQQMTGKLTSNSERQEMGEVRETSGKAAARELGDSRAYRD